MNTDIVVVGGGLVGFAAAICVAKLGFNVVHLAPLTPVDRRTSALMLPSIDILTKHRLIDTPDDIAVSLEKIRLIDATKRLLRAPEALFDSAEFGHTAFGWNFANSALLARFSAVATDIPTYTPITASFDGLTRRDDAFLVSVEGHEDISCALVIGADGKKSSVRAAVNIGVQNRIFEQSALVCNLELDRSIGTTSVEFHYENGPFTLVPAGNKNANLVWIDKAEVLDKALEFADLDFQNFLRSKAQNLFGNIKLTSSRYVFPLATLLADTAGKDGVLLAGEAAHAFPPIGAQGLNLGLRDIDDIVTCLGDVKRIDTGWADKASQHYNNLRHQDMNLTGSMVDTLFKSLLAEMLPAQALRAGGIWALKLSAPLRKRAFSVGMGTRAT